MPVENARNVHDFFEPALHGIKRCHGIKGCLATHMSDPGALPRDMSCLAGTISPREGDD